MHERIHAHADGKRTLWSTQLLSYGQQYVEPASVWYMARQLICVSPTELRHYVVAVILSMQDVLIDDIQKRVRTTCGGPMSTSYMVVGAKPTDRSSRNVRAHENKAEL